MAKCSSCKYYSVPGVCTYNPPSVMDSTGKLCYPTVYSCNISCGKYVDKDELTYKDR